MNNLQKAQPILSDQRSRLLLALWLFSRLLIVIVVLLFGATETARSMGVVRGGWHLFTHWDGSFYREIATQGYRFSPDLTAGVSVAFFPLFPLLSWGLTQFGIPFDVGGTLINNLAFGGAVFLLYRWISDSHPTAAVWVVAVLVLSPFSLFGAVAYTEGLFLLLTIAALRAYERYNYRWMAVCGALSTATRPTGIVLIPAFLLAAWWECRSAAAYFAGAISAIGILSYSFYCWLQFDDPLAFLQAQYAWRSPSGFAWQGWLKILTQVFLGSVDWDNGILKTPWHPISLLGIAIAALCLWQTRQRWHSAIVDYSFCVLGLLIWIVVGDPVINFAMVFGIGFLLWRSRFELSPIVLTYGFCALGLILVSGSTISLGRISYGVVSGTIALGLLLSKHPRWGYAMLSLFTLLLISFSARFAQLFWAG